jgi:[ribosomal protein S5]-alanine N-acetyltransferase
MKEAFQTARLILDPLKMDDAAFIIELVNTPGWIQFIGDRNIKTKEAAGAYIQKIHDNPGAQYWVVKLVGDQSPVGLITRLQRDYLDHPDIGFAFLPSAFGQGYALEASIQIMTVLEKENPKIYGITIPENMKSIQLLEKLGLHFEREMVQNEEALFVYSKTIKK